jgi:hypothetical protein
MIKKETSKTLQYKYITIEIEHMLNVKTKVISVLIWAIGTFSISFGNCLKNTQENHEIKELQKLQKFWYCIPTSESTNKKYGTFNMETNIKRTINCNSRKAVDRLWWQHDVRSWSAAARILGLRVRIPLGHECCVLCR